jgi:3-oxoacyl-[acyl-carrier protein] reductase
MPRLDGKIALVTGAGAGIGEAIARRFRAEGASLVVNDLDAARAERVARDVGGWSFAADVADSGAVARMFEAVAARHGRLDVLVNNAGIAGHESDPSRAERFASATLAQMQERATSGASDAHDVTLETTDMSGRDRGAPQRHLLLRASAASCRRSSGSIINMGSIMGTAGGAGVPGYCAAKAGILGLTRALARELATRQIRVNAIAPGWIETAMTAPLAPLRPILEMQTPLGRMGSPDDIAHAAVYLASDEASFVTGQVLSPNGGWHMSQSR